MKKTISIFLFILICISHLNIIDAFTDVRSIYMDNTGMAKFPIEEEKSAEKDNEGKSKQEEEKMLFTITALNRLLPGLSNHFVSYHNRLLLNPYLDNDIQPPKAV